MEKLSFRLVVTAENGSSTIVKLNEEFATQTGYLEAIAWAGMAGAFRDYCRTRAEMVGQWFPKEQGSAR